MTIVILKTDKRETKKIYQESFEAKKFSKLLKIRAAQRNTYGEFKNNEKTHLDGFRNFTNVHNANIKTSNTQHKEVYVSKNVHVSTGNTTFTNTTPNNPISKNPTSNDTTYNEDKPHDHLNEAFFSDCEKMNLSCLSNEEQDGQLSDHIHNDDDEDVNRDENDKNIGFNKEIEENEKDVLLKSGDALQVAETWSNELDTIEETMEASLAHAVNISSSLEALKSHGGGDDGVCVEDVGEGNGSGENGEEVFQNEISILDINVDSSEHRHDKTGLKGRGLLVPNINVRFRKSPARKPFLTPSNSLRVSNAINDDKEHIFVSNSSVKNSETSKHHLFNRFKNSKKKFSFSTLDDKTSSTSSLHHLVVLRTPKSSTLRHQPHDPQPHTISTSSLAANKAEESKGPLKRHNSFRNSFIVNKFKSAFKQKS